MLLNHDICRASHVGIMGEMQTHMGSCAGRHRSVLPLFAVRSKLMNSTVIDKPWQIKVSRFSVLFGSLSLKFLACQSPYHSEQVLAPPAVYICLAAVFANACSGPIASVTGMHPPFRAMRNETTQNHANTYKTNTRPHQTTQNYTKPH